MMALSCTKKFYLLLAFITSRHTISSTQVHEYADRRLPRLEPVHWSLLTRKQTNHASRFNSSEEPPEATSSIFLSRHAVASMASDVEVEPLFARNGQLLANYIAVEAAPMQKFRVKRTDGSMAEQMSKNVTKILEGLLKDYDKTERPAFKSGDATKVRINILIRSMGPISEEDMNYSMDCYFRQYWRDERLSFTGLKKNNAHQIQTDQLSLNVKMLEKIWKPDTYFFNGLSSYLHTITRPNKLLRISEHGDITYSMRLTIKAKCPMMLRSFPMDWQSCPLVVGSFAYRINEMYYVWSRPDNAVSYEGKLELSQFDIMETAYRSLNYSRGHNKGTYSVLQVVIALQRHTGYFLIQIYLPCTLLVVLSWVGFWLNREATSDRVGLGITTVLTLSTIALESRTDLPKVHYATAMDWFIICSFGYCIATLLEFAGVHYFTKVGSGEVFSTDDPITNDDEFEEDDDWQDLEVSEELGAVTPMTPLTPLGVQDDMVIFTQPRRENFHRPSSMGRCSLYEQHSLCGIGCELGPMGDRRTRFSNHHNGNGSFDQSDIYDDDYGLDFRLRHDADPPDCSPPPPPPPPPPPSHRFHQISTIMGSNGHGHGHSQEFRRYPPVNDRVIPTGAVAHMINSVAFLSSGTVNAPVKQAQTQTERKISCLKQFLYCLLANQDYRKQRQVDAVKHGSTNSTSKIDSVARILFPVSFGLFNITYWYSYFQAQKPFDWDDHSLKGNVLTNG